MPSTAGGVEDILQRKNSAKERKGPCISMLLTERKTCVFAPFVISGTMESEINSRCYSGLFNAIIILHQKCVLAHEICSV